jgi:hypothetical protein
MRSRFVLSLTVGCLVFAICAPSAAAGPLPSGLGTMAATSFSPVGDGPIDGWYWMRSATYVDSGTWRFADFDRSVLSSSNPLVVYLTPLVTQAASGGSGWSARIKVKVTQQCASTVVTLANRTIQTTNRFPLKTTASTGGVGYQNYASFTVSKSVFKCATGTVFVVVTRDSTYKVSGYRPHVGINQDAVTLHWYTAP